MGLRRSGSRWGCGGVAAGVAVVVAAGGAVYVSGRAGMAVGAAGHRRASPGLSRDRALGGRVAIVRRCGEPAAVRE